MFTERRHLRSFLDYLGTYLDAPRWDHALQVVPFALHASRRGHRSLPECLTPELGEFLAQCLDQWSAFRRGGDRGNQLKLFHRGLPKFAIALERVVPSCKLADVTAKQVDDLAGGLIAAFDGFKVKATRGGSVVLQSKAAHLLLPSLVPPIDKEVIVNQVLSPLLERGAGRGYLAYFRLAWWVIQRMQRDDVLDEARGLVARHLASNWAVASIAGDSGFLEALLLTQVDSLVAEYALIGLAEREAPRGPLLGWSVPTEVLRAG